MARLPVMTWHLTYYHARSRQLIVQYLMFTSAPFRSRLADSVTFELRLADTGNASNPGVLSDIFCRVGGSNLDREVSTDVMVRIHSDYVLGDNLWLWRADHV